MLRKKLFAIILLSTFFSCRKVTYETILIPEGYRGDVIIIFNQKGKEKRKFEGKHKVYEIPNDGILLTEFKDEGKGFAYVDYFYIDSLGDRKKLEKYSIRNQEHEGLGIYGGTIGVLGSNELPFYLFYVGNKSDYLNQDNLQAENELFDKIKLKTGVDF